MSEILELLQVEDPGPEYQRMVDDHRKAKHRSTEAEPESYYQARLSSGQSYLARKLRVWG